MGNITSQLEEQERRALRGHPRPNLNRIPEYYADDAHVRATWTRDVTKLERRRRRWAKKLGSKYDKVADTFLTSSALMNDTPDRNGLPWEATDLLGKGGFGIVGLWQQLDRNGNAVNSLAIKQTQGHTRIDMASRRGSQEDMPSEAFWTDLLSRKTPYIPYLRKLVFLLGDPSMWRYYFEYCPHGDLYELITLYTDFNKNHSKDDEQVIPELYIWFMLYGLAHALEKLDLSDELLRQLKQDLVHEFDKGKNFVLHLDIKDVNIMLGNAFPDEPFSKYPLGKLGDFGLAQLTSRRDQKNSKKLNRWGTECWHPPEQFDRGHIDHRWKEPRIHPGGDPNYPFDQRHGVWQIAAVCFSMMLLVRNNKWLDKELVAFSQDKGAETRTRLTNGFVLDGMMTKESFRDFSVDLMNTLNQCLSLLPQNRPFPDELLKICREGIGREVARLGRHRMPVPPVFYGQNGKYELEDYVRRKPRPPPRQNRWRRLSNAWK